MIIFYNKKTGEIIGTIEGRVHFDHQLNVSIGSEGHDQKDIDRLIIGYTEDNNGERIEHNMHLWEHQLVWEDPKHPRHPLKDKVKINKNGKVSIEAHIS